MSFLHIQGVDKRFDEPVLTDVSLSIERGEVVALLGPSGSGKTTLLRIIAGFETADRGTIEVGGQDITRLGPAERRCGMVFQNYALFPHLSVGANIAFGLAGQAREKVAARVDEMLEVVGLAGLGGRRIDQISGGQQQRVAVARALAPSPRVLLLDEPLSNLDPDLRERTRRQLKQIIQATGITTVLVTHEQEEAFHVANRTAVLGDGQLRQVATAEELYFRPADLFVAGFVGRGSEIGATVDRQAPAGWRLGRPPLDPTEVWSAQPLEGQARAWIRPESLTLAAGDGADGWAGRVVEVRWHPRSGLASVALDGGGEVEVSIDAGAPAPKAGQAVRVAWNADGPPALLFGDLP